MILDDLRMDSLEERIEKLEKVAKTHEELFLHYATLNDYKLAEIRKMLHDRLSRPPEKSES